ncbi:PREDICTED: SLIT and NTRK-like protein 4 [Branchiostoma belcheri]|uniref:SLIT and NTRK-like protein 4 n=1 Tax=Branchiostoma belcheri TaxID=7741 RepID=A0A6P5AJF8_BRABE|nr:PREDICTED: SLIT and NTRK-like protein 4 [Branchiostoma belcheri]
MKRLLVLLLILLKETDPVAARSCGNICSWSLCAWNCFSCACCDCSRRGLTSVPQDLMTNITHLYLSHNSITTLSQSDFSRYSSLAELHLDHNQISVINSGAFYIMSTVTYLTLNNNQLTSLRSGMFVGLESLWFLTLSNNHINSISAGALENLRALQYIGLSHNNISTIPVEALSTANTSHAMSTLLLNNNQMETLPSAAYDLLSSFSNVNINNNPWPCDCRMLPFKQRMNGSLSFEQRITCAGPEHLAGNLLLAVDPEDLICAETSSISSSIGSTGSTSTAICLPTWCLKKRVKTSPAPVPDPSDVSRNPNGAAAGPTSGRTDQGASQVTDLEQDILMA